MKVLFDTNVVLDVMLDREPFAVTAAELMSRVESGDLAGYLGATTVTTIHYLAAKTIGAEQARLEVRKLLQLFEIAPVNRPVLDAAAQLEFDDFEDAVLHESAVQSGVQAIVTRNKQDFEEAALPVYSPVELMTAFSQRDAAKAQPDQPPADPSEREPG